MELKLILEPSAGSGDIVVLIVPLWNWNRIRNEKVIRELRSNRTFMELKFVSVPGDGVPIHGSNRTFMELKYVLDTRDGAVLKF